MGLLDFLKNLFGGKKAEPMEGQDETPTPEMENPMPEVPQIPQATEPEVELPQEQPEEVVTPEVEMPQMPETPQPEVSPEMPQIPSVETPAEPMEETKPENEQV